MTAAGHRPISGCQLIVGTLISIIGIIAVFQIATKPVVIHFCAAVGTIDQTSQWIGFPHAVMPSGCFPQLLDKLPGFPVNNRLVGISKDHPIFFRIADAALVLVGLLVVAEIYCITHILRLGKNLPNDIATPVIRVRKLFFVLPKANATLSHIHTGRFNLILI